MDYHALPLLEKCHFILQTNHSSTKNTLEHSLPAKVMGGMRKSPWTNTKTWQQNPSNEDKGFSKSA
jgi:hypothetical protein